VAVVLLGMEVMEVLVAGIQEVAVTVSYVTFSKFINERLRLSEVLRTFSVIKTL